VRRLLHFGEWVVIGAGIALGSVWPSIYTVVAIAVLPAFFVALGAVVQPMLVEGQGRRQWLRTYLHGSAAISAFMLVFQSVWLLFTHSAPVDIIVEAGSAGPVIVVYEVIDGVPLQEFEGRRVYEIPSSRVLATQSEPNGGWWLQGERRFFAREERGNLRKIPGRTGSSGTAQWGGCTARFDEFIIMPNNEVPEELYWKLDDRESWNVVCTDGQLTMRSS